MILLDTNVLSETLRPHPDPDVVVWVDELGDAVVSAVSVGEMCRAALALPSGRRRDTILAQIDATLAEHVSLVLPYNGVAARVYAQLHARRRSMGRPLATEDGMIAATAIVHSAKVATRNVSDFADLGLEIINPWEL
jgi:predicted nucleic acid-binding protein